MSTLLKRAMYEEVTSFMAISTIFFCVIVLAIHTCPGGGALTLGIHLIEAGLFIYYFTSGRVITKPAI